MKKRIVLLLLSLITLDIICVGNDVGKNAGVPASENLKQTLDANAPILSQGMQGLGKEFGQVMMQNLPQNIALAGAIAIGTVVASKVTDASIRHIEKTISGELAAEQVKNQRKQLESYRNLINSYSMMSDQRRKELILIKEHQLALNDFIGCYKNTVSQWIPFTRNKMYCTEDGFPMECTEELFRVTGTLPSPYSKTLERELISTMYQKK